MSRKSVLTTETARAPTCTLCGAEITHDVARIDEGRIYHLRCFEQAAPSVDTGLYGCPKCRTLGGTWDRGGKRWRECGLCFGIGYLAAPEGTN